MARKKKGSNLGTLIVAIVVVAALAFGCWKFMSVRVFGSYEISGGGSLLSGKQTYTFSGINKVSIDGEASILGFSNSTTQEGTYKISGNEITFTFKEKVTDKDGNTTENKTEKTYSFYRGKDTIKINDVEYKKVK